MVEINNQRKGVPRYAGVVGGTDNGRQKTRNHGYDVIVGGRAIYRLPRSISRKLVTLNPKLKSTGAGRYQLLSCWWMPTVCLAWVQSQDAVALQQIKERGALPMIDRGGYPSGNRPLQQYLGFTAGLVMVSSSIRLTAWLKIQLAAERSERLMVEQSHRDYLRSGYLYLSSARRGLLIITVITPLPTKFKRDKNARELRLHAAITDMQMRQRDVAAPDAKYTKELADATKMMLCVMMLPLVVVGCTSKQSVSHAWSHHRLRRG